MPTFQANAVFAFFTQLIDSPLMAAVDAMMGNGLRATGALVVPLGTVLLAFYGLSISRGWTQAPVGGFVALVLKLGVFAALVGVGTYSYFVRDFILTALPAHVGQLVSQTTGIATGAAAYDTLWNQAIVSGLSVWNGLGTYNPLRLLVLVFWFVALGGICAGYGIWLMARIMGVLYVGFGPLLLPLALFAATRTIFSNWIGAMLSTVVLQGLSVGLASLLMGAEGAILSAVVTGGSSDTYARIGLMFAAIAIFVLCGWFALRLPAAAASICGGVHFSPDRVVGATYGAVGSAAKQVGRGIAKGAVAAGRAAQQRIASRGMASPPGPTLSRTPAIVGTKP